MNKLRSGGSVVRDHTVNQKEGLKNAGRASTRRGEKIRNLNVARSLRQEIKQNHLQKTSLSGYWETSLPCLSRKSIPVGNAFLDIANEENPCFCPALRVRRVNKGCVSLRLQSTRASVHPGFFGSYQSLGPRKPGFPLKRGLRLYTVGPGGRSREGGKRRKKITGFLSSA